MSLIKVAKVYPPIFFNAIRLKAKILFPEKVVPEEFQNSSIHQGVTGIFGRYYAF